MMFRNSAPQSSPINGSSSSRVRRSHSRGFESMTPLATDFVLGDDDVLVMRGKKPQQHRGNQRFKDIVATKLNSYLAAECRVEKTAILMEVIAEVRMNSPRGGFVKQNPKTGQYFEVGDFLAKEKTAQAFRDALHEYYSSSNPSKKKRRIQSSGSNGSSSEKQEEDDEEGGEDESETCSTPQRKKNNGQSLVDAMHHEFSRKSRSAPTSPAPHRLVADYDAAMSSSSSPLLRASTPPPSFARFVSSSEPNRTATAKRKSSVILAETFAVLSSVCLSSGGGDGDDDDNMECDDPFEPIPLSMYNDVALSKFT